MRCLFCKADSSNSKSVEHIVPESLGNKNQILSKGVVCDSCNNYFAHKIEKVVLEMPYFQSLRGRKMIENKKGKIPRISGFTKDKNIIEFSFSPSKSSIIDIVTKDEKILNFNKLYVPIIPEPPRDNLHVSKFIGKIAIEALANRVSTIKGWQDDFVDNEGLDELRNFVRYGKGYSIWPYLTRRIYGELQINYDKSTKKLIEKMNEYDFFIPDRPIIRSEYQQIDNLYFVMCILGIEYTINLTPGGLDRYMRWLSDNQNKSILLMEKHEFIQV